MKSNEHHRIQAAIIKHARAWESQFPPLRDLYAIPNGGARDERTGAMLKREGVRPGIPDLRLPVAADDPRGGFFIGLYIEVKTKNDKLRDSQAEYRQRAIGRGHAYAVVRTAQKGVECFIAYLRGQFRFEEYMP